MKPALFSKGFNIIFRDKKGNKKVDQELTSKERETYPEEEEANLAGLKSSSSGTLVFPAQISL